MKRRDRRFFSDEFKLEAAKLVVNQGYTVNEACQAFDVGRTAMNRWMQQLQDERGGKPLKGKALTPEQKRIQGLETQVDRLEKEKSILKKLPLS